MTSIIRMQGCGSQALCVFTSYDGWGVIQEDQYDTELTPKQVVDRLDRYIVGQVRRTGSGMLKPAG